MPGDGVQELLVPSDLGVVVDLAPVEDRGRPVWLVLAEDGRISRWDLGTGEHELVGITTVAPEPDHDPWPDKELRRHLHASGNGAFAAVVNDYGHFGEVLDLRAGEVTMVLENEHNDLETVPFSLAFGRSHGRDVVIHRTEWNRLDVSDPQTGKLLTDRPSRVYDGSEVTPEHDLDYFHGALYVSPDSRWVLDDGWVWHPIGFPAVWDLERWIGNNVWESEDGPTRVELCDREYYWDHPMVWIDSVRVAVEGVGISDLSMRPGARIFDVSQRGLQEGWKVPSPAEVLTFEGPAGRFFSDGTSLFSSAEAGLSVWELTEGKLVDEVPGFVPTHHHRAAGQFLQLADGAVHTLRR
ncbi:hypothetical protein AB0P21_27035 [Kribbella sp. NPDC056861]|uniref:hypothetical protein n=1 Tax=Kribbella sp. NPDC056861 TaxID=3154857 RepID=UPI0034358992